MTLFGQGCSYYVLSDNGGQSSSRAGSTMSGLSVEERSSGAQIAVTVSNDGQVLVQRSYDEAFFRSGRVDEFEALAPTGQGLLLKYWGTVETDDNHHCAPFDDALERQQFDDADGSSRLAGELRDINHGLRGCLRPEWQCLGVGE